VATGPECAALARILTARRYPHNSEIELQNGMETVLRLAGLNYQREVRNIAVEMKVAGSRADVLRQLHRYAQFDGIEGIVLVTTKAPRPMPGTLNGKPVMVASLLNGAL